MHDNDKVNRDIQIVVQFQKLVNNQPTGGKWMTSLSGMLQLRVTLKVYHWKSIDVLECLASLWKITVCSCRNCGGVGHVPDI